MYENENVTKLYVLQCISMVIDYGCTYGHLLFDLRQYIPNLKLIASEEHEFSVKKEMLKIIYLFTKHVSIFFLLIFELCKA